jgi:hypothetical protein
VSTVHWQCDHDDGRNRIHWRLDRASRKVPFLEKRTESQQKHKSKGGSMGEVTHEKVNLMLRLFEERREPRLREARDWYGNNFRVQSVEDMMRLCPFGSKENAYMRMVLSYWDMVAGIVNRGLIDEDLFFESTGEQWVVFEQIKPALAGCRAMFSSPKFLANLEEQCRRLEAWREKRNPGANEAMRKLMAQMMQTAQAAKAQAAAS